MNALFSEALSAVGGFTASHDHLGIVLLQLLEGEKERVSNHCIQTEKKRSMYSIFMTSYCNIIQVFF